MVATYIGIKRLLLALLANVVICDDSVFFPGASTRKQDLDSEEAQGTVHTSSISENVNLSDIVLPIMPFRKIDVQDIIRHPLHIPIYV